MKIKLKDITSKRPDVVSGLKAHSPEFSVVKIYEYGPARFIHSFQDDTQMLSISRSSGKVAESDWILGIQQIMKMELVEVLINVRPSVVVIIREKPDHLPRTAH